MSGYGQFCPVAKAMEVLDERWTLLVVRELLAGSTHFNQLRRGVPKMSPALLAKRLRTLERCGVLTREVTGGRTSYRLTPCGLELTTVVEALGVWGVRWIGELGQADLDPHLLMWDLRRTVSVERWPRSRTVVHVEFDDLPPKVAEWWVVVTEGEVDVCDVDPGFETVATLRTSLREFTRVWRGDQSWSGALRSGTVRITGSDSVRRAVPHWLGQSTLARTARPA
jgi:DNA-binding HxlR family transcriptional regulator